MNDEATPTVHARTPVAEPPAWAVLQRRLFDVLDEAWRVFAAKYTEADGRLRYAGSYADRDGVDDFYEPFFNWPTLYALGGSDDILEASKRHWNGVTAQLTELGYLVDEFERGYDWFHQGESLLFFYAICAADPQDPAFRERADRFARLYLPGGPNYDAATNTITAPHNGAVGPRPGLGQEWESYGAHLSSMRPYGLPLHDLDGIDTWDDLAVPANADRMGRAMTERMGIGDTAVNLAATGLVANAWLYDHDPAKAEWIERYVDGWLERAAANDGLVPDNVGPNGAVGELHGGRWYGGHYGWTWPHGLASVGQAALVAGQALALVTGDQRGLALSRNALEAAMSHRRPGRLGDDASSLTSNWLGRFGPEADTQTVLVPLRVGPNGWFDFSPVDASLPTWLWYLSRSDDDWARIATLRSEDGFDWRAIGTFRDKAEAGHEHPWLAYLDADNPDYPERALTMAMGQVNRRLSLIDADRTSPDEIHIHHWQQVNPVVTEVLMQLTTGAPQVPYNGGLRSACLTYVDADRGRQGLPPDVAALVSQVRSDGCSVELINLGRTTRTIMVVGGAFGEHVITSVRHEDDTSAYPGAPGSYRAPEAEMATDEQRVDDTRFRVVLPSLTRLRLEIGLQLRARTPGY